MFRELMYFSYQRTALQAVGWYLAFLLLGALAAGTVSGIMAAATGTGSFTQGIRAGAIIIIPYHIVLAVALLWTRWRSVLNIVLAILAILISLFLGALGGLIPLAVLTTRPSRISAKEIGEVFK
jgi:hypothetical protein